MKLLKPDPMGESRNPFQVYLLCLAIFTALTMLVSDVKPSAGTLDHYLDGWEETAWSLLLISGSSFALAGMFWLGDPRDALFIKRIGFTILSVPVFIYGAVLFLHFGFRAFSIAMILWGFAVASSVQAYRVNKHIKRLIAFGDAKANDDGEH